MPGVDVEHARAVFKSKILEDFRKKILAEETTLAERQAATRIEISKAAELAVKRASEALNSIKNPADLESAVRALRQASEMLGPVTASEAGGGEFVVVTSVEPTISRADQPLNDRQPQAETEHRLPLQ